MGEAGNVVGPKRLLPLSSSLSPLPCTLNGPHHSPVSGLAAPVPRDLWADPGKKDRKGSTNSQMGEMTTYK